MHPEHKRTYTQGPRAAMQGTAPYYRSENKRTCLLIYSATKPHEA